MKTIAKRRPGRPPNTDLTQRRRSEILAAAALLFARKGYADTTTQDLADLLGVGKGTLYRYFPSKEALFLAAADWGMEQLHETIQADLAGIDDPLERIAGATRCYLSFFAAHPEFVELFIQERAQFRDRKKPTYIEHRDRHIHRWQAQVVRLIGEGRVRDLPVERMGDVMSDLLYGTMFTNYFIGPRRSPVEQAEDIVDIMLRGILSDSERRRRETEADDQSAADGQEKDKHSTFGGSL